MSSSVRFYIGMDVHQSSTTICVVDGESSEKGRYRTSRCDTTRASLEATLSPYAGRCKVAFEVCTQAQWMASIVRPLAVEVQVANASRIPWLFRDGRKNDRLDARKLATLLYLDQLPTVHLPTAEVSAWRVLINYRRSLVNGRTRLRNRVRSVLRSFGRRCPHRSCWTAKGMTWLKTQVFDDIRNLMIHHLLDELDHLDKQMASVEKRLGEIAEHHPGVALLQTVPGIGPRTAEAIIAFGDQVQRFRNRRHFTSYFGMTPTEDSSGKVVRRGRISKRGPSVVRWVLIEAARSAIRHDSALRSWYERIHKGRQDRRKKAVVATGRKILSICYGMLRTGEVFDSERVATRPAA